MLKVCSSCSECQWAGEEGRWSLGGGGHTDLNCIAACQTIKSCNFASISHAGYCHMTTECEKKDNSSKTWTMYKKGKTPKSIQ